MQEIKKRRIVLASVLKPVNDTRMSEKLGSSLCQDYDVHIIGFAAPGSAVPNKLTAHPLPFFKRLSVKRLLSRWMIFRWVVQLRPAIFIVTTHELLVPGLLAKALFGCHLVYDIQENYWRNILYTPAFPRVLRPFIAAVVRLRERMAMPFIDHCFLAEASYRQELRFLSDRFTILENKATTPPTLEALPLYRRYPPERPLRLLFSGTLSESTGVFIAVALARGLYALDSSIRLTVIGYCPLPEQLARLKRECAADYIELIGGDRLVPHADILAAIQLCDVGILAYPPNPATENAVPTKLYEYMGYHLPLLLIDHPVWMQRCAPFAAAVIFSEPSPDVATVLHQLRTQTFYTSRPTGVYWDAEAEKLLAVVKSI